MWIIYNIRALERGSEQRFKWMDHLLQANFMAPGLYKGMMVIHNPKGSDESSMICCEKLMPTSWPTVGPLLLELDLIIMSQYDDS